MKKLILLDIDGTLLKSGELIDAALLQPHMTRLMQNGWTIGLNSGRMLRSLSEIHQSLGLNGPIIAEFGNEISWESQSFQFRDPQIEAAIHEAKLELANKLTIILPNARILLRDTHELAPIKHASWSSLDIVSVMMPRHYSLFYTCRKITATDVTLNWKLLQFVMPHARQIFEHHFPRAILENVDKEFCAHVLYPPHSFKFVGVRILQSQFPAISEIHMVGDCDVDILYDIENVRHYAVANATENMKNASIFTAKSPYAMGAIECLQAIEQINCSPRSTPHLDVGTAEPWRINEKTADTD